MAITIITGASSGIGAALALELGRRGHRLGLIARREQSLHELAERIRTKGGTAVVAAADVTDRSAVERAVTAIEAELGPCDLLIANAGGDVKSPPHDVRITDWLAVMRLNFDGVVHAVGATLPGMLSRGRGHISVVSSQGRMRGFPGIGPYAASKAAVTTLFESLRQDLKPHGIAVTAIHPGYVSSELTAQNHFDMPGLMSAERAAVIIADGLERSPSRIDFPWGTTLQIRLVSLLPDFLFDWLMRRVAPPIHATVATK